VDKIGTEATLVSNSFGEVTTRRIIYIRAKGWFGGGTREDIPLQHVTSVRLEISRNILAGILFVLIGLAVAVGGASGLTKVCGLVVLLLGALFLWGSPAVVVNTAGQDLRPSKGKPWERAEANFFVDALRTQLFRG
jgi:hypothetical protein